MEYLEDEMRRNFDALVLRCLERLLGYQNTERAIVFLAASRDFDVQVVPRNVYATVRFGRVLRVEDTQYNLLLRCDSRLNLADKI